MEWHTINEMEGNDHWDQRKHNNHWNQRTTIITGMYTTKQGNGIHESLGWKSIDNEMEYKKMRIRSNFIDNWILFKPNN